MLSLEEVIQLHIDGCVSYKGASIGMNCNSQYPIAQIPLHCMNRRFWAKKSWHHITDVDEAQKTDAVLSYKPKESDYSDIAGSFFNQATDFFGWLNGYELDMDSEESLDFTQKLCALAEYAPYTEHNIRDNGDVQVLNVVCFFIRIKDLYNLCYSYSRCGMIDKILLDLEEEQDLVRD